MPDRIERMATDTAAYYAEARERARNEVKAKHERSKLRRQP